MSLYDYPEYSPWGAVQHSETLCAGAYQVSTASHGGVMVRAEIMNEVLSPEAPHRPPLFCEGCSLPKRGKNGVLRCAKGHVSCVLRE